MIFQYVLSCILHNEVYILVVNTNNETQEDCFENSESVHCGKPNNTFQCRTTEKP